MIKISISKSKEQKPIAVDEMKPNIPYKSIHTEDIYIRNGRGVIVLENSGFFFYEMRDLSKNKVLIPYDEEVSITWTPEGTY